MGRAEARPTNDPGACPSLLLGVVVPALDEAEHLPRLLERLTGVEEAADRPDDLVVVDGGSRDGTRDIAARAGARVLRTEPGRGVQLAAGVRAVRGDVVLVLHADARPAPGALAVIRRAFAADPALAGTAMHQQIDAAGAFYRLVERAADSRARRGMVLGDSGLAVRRSAYEAAGGFRPLSILEDVDLSRRLRRVGPVRLLPEATLSISARRWRREGALRCTLRNWMLRGMFAVGVAPARLARFYPGPGPPP